jgi:ribosome-associated protein
MAQASKSSSPRKSASKAPTHTNKSGTSPKKAAAKPVKPVKAKKAAKAIKPPLLKVIETALDDIKALNVQVFDVRELTDVADTMVIASGTSDRHVRSIADRVVEAVKKAGFRPMGVEGERDGEWVLVDLQDVILHVMLPRVRDTYRLESLWDVSAARREVAGA